MSITAYDLRTRRKCNSRSIQQTTRFYARAFSILLARKRSLLKYDAKVYINVVQHADRDAPDVVLGEGDSTTIELTTRK